MTPLTRSCGLLCHPTSLPGRGGVGDLGPGVDRFLEFMAAAGHTVWQILPLGPTGYGDSPYQPFSAYAGNPLLIDLDDLAAEGLLTAEEAAPIYPFPEDEVRYGDVIGFKTYGLRRAYDRYCGNKAGALADEIAAFGAANAHWLPDYALFMALKLRHNWAAWSEWRPRSPAGSGRPGAVPRRAGPRDRLPVLRAVLVRPPVGAGSRLAAERGITIVGDIPIFMATTAPTCGAPRHSSAWTRAAGPRWWPGCRPTISAHGPTVGQPALPLGRHAADGYRWWLDRLHAILSQVDMVRLDHFRGFAGYGKCRRRGDAVNGRWVKGPGIRLFPGSGGGIRWPAHHRRGPGADQRRRGGPA
jgi:4-alpha-glucanotransferase